MKKVKIIAALLLAGMAVWGGEQLFSVSFGDYSPGEALSAKGVTGGSWQTEGVATNVAAAGRSAMSVLGKMEFASAGSATKDVEHVDIPVMVGPLEELDIHASGDAGGFMPALVDANTPGFLVWGNGAWHRTTADGVVPVEGEWLELRVEFRELEGEHLVRYLVKKAGGEYVVCQTVEGRSWFLGKTRAANRRIEFVGNGAFADFVGSQETGDAVRTFHWNGGASGNWSDAANWAEGRVPDAGSFAFVTNVVQLTNGTEVAQVKSLVVADGNQLVGGNVKTEVKLKTNRPQVGKALEPKVSSFFGVMPDYSFTWQRGNWAKTWEMGVAGQGREYTPTANDYGKWLRLTVSNATEAVFSKEFYFSSLPVCYLTTDDGGSPSASKEVHSGTLFVQGNDDFKHQYDGRLEFHVRGNSSASHPKKSYKLKLEEKTKMFELGKKSKHWVMTGSYNDVSLLRNKLAADFANAIGSLGMRSTWADCVLNGEYRGTYLFMESIRIASDRVDIFDWNDVLADYGATETDLSPIDAKLAEDPNSIDISGGYLFELGANYDELSKFKINSGNLVVPTMVREPEYLRTSTKMMEWCQQYFQKYWDACTSLTHLSGEGKHWSEYSDVDSMVNYWLVMELHGNLDAYQKSRYVYIDRGGKLVWGPVWDFDYASASITVPTAQAADTWMCTNKDWDQSANTWNESSWVNFTQSCVYKEWASDPYFCMKAWERYWEIRGTYAELMREGGTIEQYAAKLEGPLTVNDQKCNRGRTHAVDTSTYKAYLQQRLPWLDRQFESVESLMASLKSSRQTVPYVRNATVLRSTVDPNEQELTVQLAGAVATVDVFLNGERLGRYPVVNGSLGRVELPQAKYSPGELKLNCVTLIAYSAADAVMARNYTLFRTPASKATRIFLR